MNQVVEKPEDEHADMNNMWRELPLWTVFLPRGHSVRDHHPMLSLVYWGGLYLQQCQAVRL
jgi:hypothetical protein